MKTVSKLNRILKTQNLSTCVDSSTNTKTNRQGYKLIGPLKNLNIMFHVSHVTCHMSCVAYPLSLVTCHLSPVTNANSNTTDPLLANSATMQSKEVCKDP